MVWLDAQFGNIKDRGEALETTGAMNFTSGLKATANDTEVKIELATDGAVAPAGAGVEVGQKWEWDGNIWIQKRGWVTIDLRNSTTTTDATAAVQDAVDQRDGVCVEFTDGACAFYDTVTFNRTGSVITAKTPRGFSQPTTILDNGYTTSGTLIHRRHTGKGIRWEQPNCRVFNLEFYDALQNHDPSDTSVTTDVAGEWNESSPGAHDGMLVHDYLFSIPGYAHGSTLGCCTAHLVYKWLSWAAGGGAIHDHKVFPLRRGLYFPRCGAAPHCSNIQMNPVGDFSAETSVADWAKLRCIQYLFDGVEGYYMENCNAFGAECALEYSDADGDDFTGVYGTWVAPDFEGCTTICRVHNSGHTYQPLSNLGGKFLGGQLVPEVAGYGFDFQDTAVPANYNNRPAIELIGTTMHSGVGMAARGIWLRSGSYGRIKWIGGDSSQLTELCRNDSANARALLRYVDSPAANQRLAGIGPIDDEGYELR